MANSAALAVDQFREDARVYPDGRLFVTPAFVVEAIPGGYRCHGEGFDFTCRVESDADEWVKDDMGRLIAANAFENTDLAISVTQHRVGLQKIVNAPGPTNFRTIVEGVVPDWFEVCDDPVAIDNFYGAKVPGRITRTDLRRDVVSGQAVTISDNVTYVDQWIEPKTYQVDPVTRIKSIDESVAYPVRLHVNYNVQLTKGTDQNRFRGEKDDTTLASAAETTRMWGYSGSQGDAIIGIIFPMTVPQGATIDDATLTVYPTSTGSNSLTWTVYADDDLTQTNWGTSDRPSQATATTASTDVVNPSTTTDTAYDIDVATIVQEIVNDAGWSSGDLIRFVLEHNASSGYSGRFIHSASAYASAGLQPELDVNYTVGGGGSVAPLAGRHLQNLMGS